VKVSVPAKLGLGVYVTVPSSFRVALPLAGGAAMAPTVRVSPSTSDAAAASSAALKLTGVSSAVVALRPSPSTGASFSAPAVCGMGVGGG
jgi:hypothetical protein